MKKIVLACGAGVATSSVVAQKVAALLDAQGMEGSYEIVQCALSEAKTPASTPTCSSRLPWLRGTSPAPT